MIADVPVSFYISGGLDSALVACIASKITGEQLNSFSITFDDPYFDESAYQDTVVRALGTNHRSVRFSQKKLASVLGMLFFTRKFPFCAPGLFRCMFWLACPENNMKVVLSGEGSDELFGGYDLFREVKIREFCARASGFTNRALLYRRVNNFVKGLSTQTSASLSFFYNNSDTLSPFGSHLSRWKLGRFSMQFFSQAFRDAMTEDVADQIIRDQLDDDFNNWSPVQRAQVLEFMTLFRGICCPLRETGFLWVRG